ncbi:hypothetical protein KC353_g885 [Hortaea werneckii]|nr:hypothetical protein KC353_g885 [Hortaea werneckii]
MDVALTRPIRYSEADIQAAILAIKNKDYPSVRKAAIALKVPYPTLLGRMSGRKSRSAAHETEQILSPTEEKTLSRWVTRLTRGGFPASPALVVEMAEELRRGRVRISKAEPQPLRPIGERWLDRFKSRNPEIAGIWTRQIDAARFKATNYDGVKRWFDAVTELWAQHQYAADHVYNMDESGFAVGASQSSRALVNIREASSWKQIGSRQEWITAIECVGAAGTAIPPLLIFKAKHTNDAWIPAQAPREWHFSTSSSGWTSDSHGYEWLTRVFEPVTRPQDPTTRRLLIMDGHSSHVTASVIAFCMENAIDLLILPPHTSHILQPLDVGVFAPLKRALASETDAALRLDAGRIARVQWVEMYIRARQRALNKHNVLSGWRSAGLMPLSPITVLGKLSASTAPSASPPRTPPQHVDLDISLLDSSPPDGTELRQATSLLITTMQACAELPSPAKRFTERMTRAFEAANSENVTLRKQVKEQAELLHARKARKKGKSVALKGRFVFSTQEVLDIARSAEAESSKKRSTIRPKRGRAKKSMEMEADGELDVVSSDSGSDCIIVSMRE